MSLYIDQKFVGLISGRLERFTKKKENLFNFRCPFCGDSQRNQRKCRGYIYQHHQFRNQLYYKCQNCGAGYTIGTFLKMLDPTLFREYLLEKFKEGDRPTQNVKKPEVVFKAPIFKSTELPKIPSIESLPDVHYAKAYILGRKIPKKFHTDLYYADDFREVVDTLLPDNTHNLKHLDPRIVIPFYDKDRKLIAIQGRALGKTELRYITIKIKNVPKIWGLDRVDLNCHVYILEGPLDATFLKNSIACAGSDFPKFPNPDNFTVVFDNEPRNKAIVKKMEQVIDEGYYICIWPSRVVQKDINDMVLAGNRPETIQSLIDQCSFGGLEAQARLQQWKKC